MPLTKQQELIIAIDKAVASFGSSVSSEEIIEAIKGSEKLGLPTPELNTNITLSGVGGGTDKSKPYNPNVSFDSYQHEEVIRQTALASRSRFLNPSTKNITSEKNGTLVDTITGADLSVFFLTELPNLTDIISKVPQHLWRKELMLIEIDSTLSFSYSIMREVFPVRSIGTTKPKSFVRGPSTISGSIAFSIFTEDVLVRLRTQMQDSITDLQNKASAVITSYRKQEANVLDSKSTATMMAQMLEEKGAKVDGAKKEHPLTSLNTLVENYKLYNQMLNAGGIFMLNQLLPFHILVMGTTERGTFSKMMIKNIRVIDENQMSGVQQPNIVNRISFVAEDIFPLMSGDVNDRMQYASTSDKDQGSISGTKLGIYTGSQVMRDVSSMVGGEYRMGIK